MDRRWVTIGSPTTEAMVNPLAAACASGYVPDDVTILSNPSVAADTEAVLPVVETICEAYDGEATVQRHQISDEADFDAVAAFFRDAIEEAAADDASVAVDITPGRKFMSAIAFQAGVRYSADHVFYLLLDSSEYYGRVYPDIPATATELIDFSEVV